ncbi:MAG: AI-2E family transporter [Thalassolituus sp.]|jgi:putative permease|uniref:AI-2E family transporter n=1 Tax=Thalassolituus maritimus TaxID=484498 RepID=A0ABQ0A010_9GAMM|nr:AI-2E family transporter [Pseudomonadota bacterium]MEC8102693.1 AI-2E family transporter [Pseudomonadota bacterium]MEC8523322.1 AI-2E family transporter [Pseudomonadota bacterium]MEE2749029.1 AI-2E family transporter [Pseudomonadota bacterium]TNC85977.1 MAG: AI-2E family transporter [Thalassolituus sp.]
MLKVFKNWIDRYFSDEEAIGLLFILVAIMLVVTLLGNVLAPFITAVIIAYLLQGTMNYCKARGFSHLGATVSVFLLFMAVMLTLLLIILPATWNQLIQFISEVPRMASKGQELLLLLPERYPELVSVEQVKEWTKQIGDEVASLGQFAVSFSLSGITGLMAVLIYCVLVPILVFFLLKDSSQILMWVTSFLPTKRSLLKNVWSEMDEQIANYIRGKALEIVIVGGVSYIAFVVLGLNYAALLAIAVGFSVLVPYIGAAVVTVPIALVAYFQWGVGDEFTWVLVVYAVIQALDGNVLVPLLFSEVVNLHPVAIIVAVLVFGGLWGFWGVFFAIPLATLLKAVMRAWPVALSAGAEEAERN